LITASLKQRIDAEKTKISEVHERISALHHEIEELTLERAEFAHQFTVRLYQPRKNDTKSYQDKIVSLRKAVQDFTEANLLSIEANSELHNIKESHKQMSDQLEAGQRLVHKLKKDEMDARQEAKSFSKTVLAIRRQMSDEEVEYMNEFLNRDNRSLDLLDAEINSINTQLSLIQGVDAGFLEEFEKRATQIDELEERLVNMNEKTVEYQTEIKKLRDRWEPELKDLLQRISESFAINFERIGCNGEVSLLPHETDFAKWSVLIKVRFRESEPMSVLNSQRQSGGERSVSTIFYLMALQSLAKAPFRVVDEINQGMDPRNERMVHERMVDIACAKNTSQYFLITPKLLTGLKYHPRMVVHTIYSGAKMPTEAGGLDIRKLAAMADIKRQRWA
jgi:chromosome segregation ATPase